MTRPCEFSLGTKAPFVLLATFVYCITLSQILHVGRVILYENNDLQTSDRPTTALESTSIHWKLSNDNSSHNIIITPYTPGDIMRTLENAGFTYHKVPLEPDETFMWKGRQRKLCKRIKKESHNASRTALYFGAPCHALHQQHRHGNLLFGLYSMHVAAAAHDADLIFACREVNYYKNIFWWVQSLPYSIELKRNLLLSPDPPISSSTCAGMGKVPVQYAAKLVKYDLRQMALSIVGPRTLAAKQYTLEQPQSSSTESSIKKDRLPSQPLHPDMDLDSVAIHFRCGDLLSNLDADTNENYGMMPFYVYSSLLQDATSIGIVTAPFDPDHLRKQDARHGRQCQELVETLRDYLQHHIPQARVSIRNDPSETIPMVFARLVMADHASICIRSTFCVFPTLASFAQKRVFLEGGISYFVSNLQEEGLVLLKSNSTPYIYSHEIHQMGWKDTVEWLLKSEEWHKQATHASDQ